MLLLVDENGIVLYVATSWGVLYCATCELCVRAVFASIFIVYRVYDCS